MGEGTGIWFGSVLRGDKELITIGARTHVQEHMVMHTDTGFPPTIGQGCRFGHKPMLHGCTIGDNSLIGMGATILNGARIGRNCLVGAGALITAGKIIEDNSVVIGAPAKTVRQLDEKGESLLRLVADDYVQNARRFAASLVASSSPSSVH